MIKLDLTKLLGFRIAGVDQTSKTGSMVGGKGGVAAGMKSGGSK